MSIRPLPDDVIAQIKSSTTITSLNGVVCGLFRNSLDAGATKVSISVDYLRGSCSVEDDGSGILPSEFQPTGGLGKLHFTSKYPAREGTHGKYGTFMASLASLSLLSVTSHHHEYHTHNSVKIHNSDVLARHTPSPPEQRLLRFPHGTRVTVRDLFGIMPVRVKQRAIDAERGVHSRHWESLRRNVVALILAWDGRVSVSVHEPINRWTFSIRGSQAHRERRSLERDMVSKVSNILYQAQLSDDNKPETWIPLGASASWLSVTGAVSLHPVATKRIQFISIGICPVLNEHGSNILYEEFNRVFSNSSYGVEEPVDGREADDLHGKERDGQYSRGKFTNLELKGRKGVDRWPMFYIQIHIQNSRNSLASNEMDDLLDMNRGNLAAIIDLLKAVAYEFLKKYRFRPKGIRNTRDVINKSSRPNSPRGSLTRKDDPKSALTTGPSKKQFVGDLATTQLSIRGDRRLRSRPESPFDLWSRVKLGSPQPSSSERSVDGKPVGDKPQASITPTRSTPDSGSGGPNSTAPLFTPDGSLLRAPFATVEPMGHSVDQSPQSASVEDVSSDDGLWWTNPVTKETLVINTKTGFAVRPKEALKIECDKVERVRSKRPRLDTGPAQDGDRSEWLKEVLSCWENPVFETTEPRIPCAFGEEHSLCRPTRAFGCSTWFEGSQGVGAPIQGRVSKAALRGAEIIAQVDRKFIFAKVLVDSYSPEPITPRSTASLLILIDQHAADERCRVESLMKDYFASIDRQEPGDTLVACTELLERPLKFDISVGDATQLERAEPHFARWGVHYKVGQRQVEVTRLPPSISERCRAEPRLLIELLRKEAWIVDEHNRGHASSIKSSTREGETTPHWIARFHGCPEGILEMINSRACRSSIMFNDPLSREQCASLSKRLADCAFPFQCAHGRPSMVPLVDLGDSATHAPSETKPGDSFGTAFKRWDAGG